MSISFWHNGSGTSVDSIYVFFYMKEHYSYVKRTNLSVLLKNTFKLG
jgi:hypothetical protein